MTDDTTALAQDVAKNAVLPITKAFKDAYFERRDEAIPVAAETFRDLESYCRRTDSSIEKIPDVDIATGVLLFEKTGEHTILLNPRSTLYRKVSLNILGLFSGMSSQELDLDFAIDHVTSSSFAMKRKLDYVAVMPVSSTVNSGYGWIEKYLADPPNKFGLVQPNIYQIMKINNVPLLSARGDLTAGLPLMIATACHQGTFERRRSASYMKLGMADGQRIETRRQSGR